MTHVRTDKIKTFYVTNEEVGSAHYFYGAVPLLDSLRYNAGTESKTNASLQVATFQYGLFYNEFRNIKRLVFDAVYSHWLVHMTHVRTNQYYSIFLRIQIFLLS